jgi:hypothetical protein
MAVTREKLAAFHDYAPVLDRLERMGYRGAFSLEI